MFLNMVSSENIWLLPQKSPNWKLRKSSEPSHVGINRKALVEDYQMSTGMCQNFSYFPAFCHYFMLTKLATSNIKVNILPGYLRRVPVLAGLLLVQVLSPPSWKTAPSVNTAEISTQKSYSTCSSLRHYCKPKYN